MSISFNSIPVSIRTPGQFIEYDNSRAVQGSPAIPNVALIIGTMIDSGGAAGTQAVETPVQVSSATAGETLFGHGSEIAQMIEAFKAANPWTELWAISLAETTTAATGTFTFAGTSTEAGNVYTYIGGERIVTAIPDATAAAAVGPLVAADVTEHLLTSNLPVSYAAPAAVGTVTCLHKGVNGNTIDLQVNYNDGESLPAGITCAVVQMSGGAGAHSVANAIATFSDSWYTTIISAYSDATNIGLIQAELLTRWGPTRMQDGHLFTALEGSQSTLTGLGNAENSQHHTIIGSGLSPTPEWVWAATVGAVDCNEPDPARPRQTLLINGVLPPLPENQFTQAERGILLTDGISTYTISQDGRCYIERLITTYQTNAGGISDPSYLDITTMRTLAYLRYTLRARIALRFPRHKLASDGTNFSPGQAVAMPSTIKSEIFALFAQWENEGLVEGWEQFKKDIIVERNANDVNRVDCLMSPDLMNQFRVFAGQLQFLL